MIPIENTKKIRRDGEILDSDILLQNQETFLTKPFCLKSPETLRIRGV